METTTTPEKRAAPDPSPRRRSAWETSQPIDGYGAPRADRRDSAVDAVVTLLATVVFGLGWALVELERADPGQDRYDAAVSVAWSSAEQPGERIERWGEVARQRSKR